MNATAYLPDNGELPPPSDYYKDQGIILPETGDESKKDFGKTRFSLVPREAYRALAELYTLGAAKYSPRGWESGMDWSRIMDALERHYNAWVEGQTHDPIDGQHHLIAVAWCAFALFSYELWGVGTDDRPRRTA
jgi:hypothetical protein